MYAIPIKDKTIPTRIRRIRHAGAGSAPVRKYSRISPKSPTASRRMPHQNVHSLFAQKKCHFIRRSA
jgi:hypothetical protein